MLPSITNVINLADSHDRAAFAMATHVKQELRERENSETKEEVGRTDRHTQNVLHNGLLINYPIRSVFHVSKETSEPILFYLVVSVLNSQWSQPSPSITKKLPIF